MLEILFSFFLCDRNVNRQNGNRLFDSQNNAKGGYACPRAVGGPGTTLTKMYYHPKSKLVIEWTAQHGCGVNSKEHCQSRLDILCCPRYADWLFFVQSFCSMLARIHWIQTKNSVQELIQVHHAMVNLVMLRTLPRTQFQLLKLRLQRITSSPDVMECMKMLTTTTSAKADHEMEACSLLIRMCAEMMPAAHGRIQTAIETAWSALKK